jgi:glycosyltransferase involved in cell wall biosynthesis
MKILMLAPQPFYEERGTLIATDLLLQALAERGDQVDLLTMHLGDSRAYSGLLIFRISPWPRPNRIRPGFSLAKIWCDVFLFFSAIRLIRKGEYDLIHAVEEASFMAVVIGKLFSTPFVLDVDSSMSTQIIDRFRWLSPLSRLLRWLEAIPARHAAAVVPMCESLAEDIASVSNQKVFVLHDIPLPGDPAARAEDLRTSLEIEDDLLVIYVGNLEPYQGIDLLLDSFKIVVGNVLRVRLVIIGGQSDDIEKYEARVNELEISEHVKFIGPRPVGALEQYLKQADLLVSPRIHGTNTPMKVYSYLGSGRAVVATNLPTHTQVMDDSTAALAAPNPEAFAEAMIRLATDDEKRERLGKQAAALAEEKYSWPAFKRQVNRIFGDLENYIARG